MINLNAKERMLLEDEKSHEELCVQKFKDYSSRASCSELKSLFSQLSQEEQQHLNSINQLLSGSMPSMGQQQGQGSQQASKQSQGITQMPNQQMQTNQSIKFNINNINEPKKQSSSYNEHDKMLCQDAISTEKYISSTYNSTIFEFRDKNIRQVLNHIQKEEQEHGEKIYNYMNQHGMYN